MGRLWSELKPSTVTEAECLAAEFEADDRPDRLDLTGTQCQSPTGAPFAFQTVRDAEQRFIAYPHSQNTALPVGGDPAFHSAVAQLVLGEDVPLDRLGAVTAAGGHGAVRLALDLLHLANRDATLWLPDQGYAHVEALAQAAEVHTRHFPLYAPEGNELHVENMLAQLRHCAAGDAIYLQACCQNPTGLDLPDAMWGAVAGIVLETGAVPFIEVTGQGLGLGLDKDVDGLQSLAIAVPEALIVVDCGPSFGLGRDAAGLVLAQGETPITANRARHQLERILAEGTGPVPDHGPNVITWVLHNPQLRTAWERDMRHNRQRLAELRVQLATALRASTESDEWDYLATGRGLFARLPLDRSQLTVLRTNHAIYVGDHGRINLSAIPETAVESVAQAVAASVAKPEIDTPDPEAKNSTDDDASDQDGEDQDAQHAVDPDASSEAAADTETQAMNAVDSEPAEIQSEPVTQAG